MRKLNPFRGNIIRGKKIAYDFYGGSRDVEKANKAFEDKKREYIQY